MVESSKEFRDANTPLLVNSPYLTADTELIKIYPSLVQLEYIGGKTQFESHSATEQKRGLITEFSPKSRKRLIEQFCKLEDLPCLFVTLTYPDEDIQALEIKKLSKKSTKDINSLQKRLKRKFPNIWGLWRREWESRKSGKFIGKFAPHFHLLLGGGINQKNYINLVQIILKMWVEVVNSINSNHSSVTLNKKSYEFLSHSKKIFYYVSKYTAKISNNEIGESIGRNWGYIHKKVIPFAEALEITLSYEDMKKIKRILKKYLKKILKKNHPVIKYFHKSLNRSVFISESTMIKLINMYNSDSFLFGNNLRSQ